MAVDEQMVMAYGRHSATKLMPNKPVSHGFKMWAAARPDGYVLHVDIATNVEEDTLQSVDAEEYCYTVPSDGGVTRRKLTRMDLQTAAIISKALDGKLENRLVAVDNYFMSAPLTDWASFNGLRIVGTLRKGKVSGELHHSIARLNRNRPGARGSAVTEAPAGSVRQTSTSVGPADVITAESLADGTVLSEDALPSNGSLETGQTVVFDQPSDKATTMHVVGHCDRLPFLMASNIPPKYFVKQTKKLRGDKAGLSVVYAPLTSVLYNRYMGGVDLADKLRSYF